MDTSHPDQHPPKLSVNKVATGTHVELELISKDGREILVFDIVPDQYADIRQGYLGEGTPLARAINGHPAGVTIPYQTEDIQSVYILSIHASINPPLQDIQARRQAVIRKAVEQSNRTDLINFASSYTGKWGDYDPDSVDDQEK